MNLIITFAQKINYVPEKFNKLIIDYNECIDDCKNHNIYKYEYNNSCYKECPINTYSIENEYLCLDIIPKRILFRFRYFKIQKMLLYL